MTEQQRRVQPDLDDEQGHLRRGADTETAEGDDTEGHAIRRADAETTDGDDTEGHAYRR